MPSCGPAFNTLRRLSRCWLFSPLPRCATLPHRLGWFKGIFTSLCNNCNKRALTNVKAIPTIVYVSLFSRRLINSEKLLTYWTVGFVPRPENPSSKLGKRLGSTPSLFFAKKLNIVHNCLALLIIWVVFWFVNTLRLDWVLACSKKP